MKLKKIIIQKSENKYIPLQKSTQNFFQVTKTTDILFKQFKTTPQGTPEIKINEPTETFCFGTPVISEIERTLGSTSFDVYSSVFILSQENNNHKVISEKNIFFGWGRVVFFVVNEQNSFFIWEKYLLRPLPLVTLKSNKYNNKNFLKTIIELKVEKSNILSQDSVHGNNSQNYFKSVLRDFES